MSDETRSQILTAAMYHGDVAGRELEIISKLQAEIRAKKEAIAELVEALERYVKEVPLGHQPHMMAHVVGELLEKDNEQV